MILKYHKQFLKSYQKRIVPNPKLVEQFKKQLDIFISDPADPMVRDHKLIGKKQSFRAFSVTGDIRVVYRVVKNETWLYDIGTHNQVY